MAGEGKESSNELLKLCHYSQVKERMKRNSILIDSTLTLELLFAGCVSFQHFYNSGFCNYF